MSELPQLTRRWEIYLVHHTHVDIGYTEPQTIVLRKHAEYIAQALDLCTETDHLPPGEQFCWTCEVVWTVKAFLARYPERAEEFYRRVREGRVEVAGLYLQLTDLFGESLLEHALDYGPELGRAHDFPVVTAMNDDVNGWAWGLPRMMAARGIKYFDVAINETRSLGVRPRPRPFYWASPEGQRVLMWHGSSYMEGNRLDPASPDSEQGLAEYLHGLEEQGYPHPAVELRVQGTRVDNAPPGGWLCDLVTKWNREHEQVKLRLTTPRAWFEHLEAAWREPIQEWRAGWPDWWADGNGTALYETSLARAAQADIEDAEAVADAGGTLDVERREVAREAAMFFCEHTWGAWCSTDDPEAFESRAGWNWKAGYAYTAGAEAGKLVEDALESCWEPGGGEPIVAVFNPLAWVRTDVVELVLPDGALRGDAGMVTGPTREEAGPGLHLEDVATGEKVAVARVPVVGGSARRPAQRVQFLARKVLALGWKEYRVVAGEEPGPSARVAVGDSWLENEYLRVTVDPATGGIAHLVDKATRREMVAGGPYTLNQHVYETIDDPAGRERLATWGGPQRDVPFRRRTPGVERRPGPRVLGSASLLVSGGGGDVPVLSTEIILHAGLPRLDLLNTLTKPATPAAEAVYHAFPVAARSPQVYLDTPGAVLRPGLDQVPGTATDWHSVQDYFAVADEDCTVVVATPDVPLVQVNGINTGLWQPELPPANGVVMSWVLNNYWFTNFPASQGGRLRFRYAVRVLSGPFEAETAKRFGQEIRHPLRALVLASGGRLTRRAIR